jgi:hypothetical protein
MGPPAADDHRRRLERKLRQLLAAAEVAGETREELRQALAAIREIEQLKRAFGRPGRRGRRPTGRKPGPDLPETPEPRWRAPRRRRTRAPQLRLEFP